MLLLLPLLHILSDATSRSQSKQQGGSVLELDDRSLTHCVYVCVYVVAR